MCSFKAYRPIEQSMQQYNMKSFPLMVLFPIFAFKADIQLDKTYSMKLNGAKLYTIASFQFHPNGCD